MKGKKTGGRQKGTPNKNTFDKSLIVAMLNEYYESGLMRSDLAELEPKDRVAAMTKMAGFVIPTMKAVSAEVDVGVKEGSLAERLIALSIVK